jgi:hypothetical protein
VHIFDAATTKDVVALARTLDLDPVVLVVGLLARTVRSHRTAARIARAIFGGKPPAEMIKKRAWSEGVTLPHRGAHYRGRSNLGELLRHRPG